MCLRVYSALRVHERVQQECVARVQRNPGAHACSFCAMTHDEHAVTQARLAQTANVPQPLRLMINFVNDIHTSREHI